MAKADTVIPRTFLLAGGDKRSTLRLHRSWTDHRQGHTQRTRKGLGPVCRCQGPPGGAASEMSQRAWLLLSLTGLTHIQSVNTSHHLLLQNVPRIWSILSPSSATILTQDSSTSVLEYSISLLTDLPASVLAPYRLLSTEKLE